MNSKMASRIILFGAIFLRVYLSYHKSGFWSDELSTYMYSAEPLSKTFAFDNSLPLFQFLLRGWIYLFGDGFSVLKLFPLLISCLTVVLVCESFSWLTLLILAINPASLEFAAQLKDSALFEFSIFLILAYLNRLDTRPLTSKRIFVLISLFIFAVWAHFLAVIFVFAVSGWLIFKKTDNSRQRDILIAFMILLFLFSWKVFSELLYLRTLGWMKSSHFEFSSDYLFNIIMSKAVFALLGAALLSLPFVYSLRQAALLWLVFLGYVFAIVLSGKLLTHFRFITPLIALLIMLPELLFQKLSGWAKYFLLIFLGVYIVFAYVEFLPAKQGSWAEAAAELCDGSGTPLTVWGNAGLRYYFPEDCAQLGQWRTFDKRNARRVLIRQQYLEAFQRQVMETEKAKVVKTYGKFEDDGLVLLDLGYR